ncbi:Uncharacterised protein [Atlantibacter hermannii]|nr:Uncharacterised protein [Atlantibacter hermannii]
MQWLNPKAWLACVAGMGLFASDGDRATLWLFAGIYFVVCYLSILSWALAGASLSGWLQRPARLRLFNRVLAVLLLAARPGWRWLKADRGTVSASRPDAV